MDQFTPVDDWDLRAVVRGCGVVEEPADCNFTDCFDLLDGFPPFDDIPSILYGWEEAFEPFSAGLAGPSSGPILEDVMKCETAEAQELIRGAREESQFLQLETSCVDGQEGKRRRRRSYYRCSSSKGCLARKQVERSSTDPGIFIVTYTGEHAHTHPTRRNPLAGVSRNNKSSSLSSSSPPPPPFLDNTAQSTLARSSSAPPETNLYSMSFEDQLDETALEFATTSRCR